MKSTRILLAATSIVLSLNTYSQTDSSRNDSSAHKMDTTYNHSQLKKGGNVNEEYQTLVETGKGTTDSSKTGVLTATAESEDSSLKNVNNKNSNSTSVTGVARQNDAAPVTPKPNFGRYFIPVLGSYNAIATTSGNETILITGDESNAGKIWVEGLAGNRIYALLKTVPGIYKIPAQKQDSNLIGEGTLIYDDNSKQISICTGCGYNEGAPAVTDAVASNTDASSGSLKNEKKYQSNLKTRNVKVISFTGTKKDQGTVSILQ